MQNTTTHEAEVVRTAGARYPFKAVCSCGFSSWGYLTDYAAQILVDAHMKEVQA